MRVTMINKYYPPHLGGVEFVMRDMAEGLVEHEGAEVRAIVSNGDSSRVEETINGVDVLRLPRAFEYASTPIAWSMPKAIAEDARRTPPPDVMHLHFPYPWGELSWMRARPDVPTIVTYHSDIVRQKVELAAYKPILNAFLDRVDLIVVSSPNMAEHSEFVRPHAEKVRVVDFGIHTERYEATPATVARAAELKAEHGGRPIVLFVGRLVYYKGADVLMRAFADIPGADLVMIGRGPLDSELRAIAVANDTIERVRFMGPQPDEELAAWYHAADVFVLPSVARSEAFGLVQIEAHASGTPVVSTDLTTGVPYANLNGVTGLTVPVGDRQALAEAIRKLLDDDELRTRLGHQAKERATTEFTIPRMAAGYMEAYRDAIERRASRSGDS
ncbi:MAG: glycosyltransferase [Coriobacteriales bacterium]|nr:glycosyltransferase [Coriobacteriales bacterium]